MEINRWCEEAQHVRSLHFANSFGWILAKKMQAHREEWFPGLHPTKVLVWCQEMRTLYLLARSTQRLHSELQVGTLSFAHRCCFTFLSAKSESLPWWFDYSRLRNCFTVSRIYNYNLKSTVVSKVKGLA